MTLPIRGPGPWAPGANMKEVPNEDFGLLANPSPPKVQSIRLLEFVLVSTT